MNTATTPRRKGRIATRQGRPAYLAPLVRTRQPVTNAEWQRQREEARRNDIFNALFGRLLGKVKGNG